MSVLTKRRHAPVSVIAIVAAGATFALSALPLSGVVRAASLTLVLVVAAREISATCRHAAMATIHEDRRRVARDLHDGLAQELAFISSQGKRLARSFDEEIAGYVGIAAQRALDESRTLIAALSRTHHEPLEQAIGRAARDVAVRAGASVELSVEPHIKLERAAEDALVRIVREAVTNAVRHGGAENIRVQLVRSGGPLLRVDDDGRGISGQPVAGFGLASMRERAESLGGRFQLVSRTGGGTSIEITLP